MVARAEIRALTGLRGVAALFAVAYHYSNYGTSVHGLAGLYLAHGYLAVDVFFVLSGFVMALTYGAGFSGQCRLGAYGTFMLKRIGRVYPMFFASTLVCVTLSMLDPAFEGRPTAWTVLTNLLMIQSWGLSFSLDYPAWSISTEFAAYLLFPVLAAVVLGGSPARCRMAMAFSAGLLLFVAARTTAEVQQEGHRLGLLDVYSAATLYPLLRCFAGFTLGICAWRLSREAAVRHVTGRPTVGLLVGLTWLGLLAVPNADVPFMLVSTVLVMVLAESRSLPARLLSTRLAYWLGVISYSLYLVHYPLRWALGRPLRAALETAGAPLPGPLSLALLVAMSLGLSEITYRLIERPGRVLAKLAVNPHPVERAISPAE